VPENIFDETVQMMISCSIKSRDDRLPSI